MYDVAVVLNCNGKEYEMPLGYSFKSELKANNHLRWMQSESSLRKEKLRVISEVTAHDFSNQERIQMCVNSFPLFR
jgi:hypothetical protein